MEGGKFVETRFNQVHNLRVRLYNNCTSMSQFCKIDLIKRSYQARPGLWQVLTLTVQMERNDEMVMEDCPSGGN